MPIREQLLVGFIAIAYALSLNYIGGPSNDQLILASLLMVTACLCRFLPVFSGTPFQWSHVFTVLAGYLVWLVVLVYTSTLPSNSIHFAWLLASFAFVTLIAADLSDRAWFFALALFSLTGLVSAVWGIGEFVVTARRADGPIVDPSSWCAICNLFFFGAVYALLRGPSQRIRALAVVGLAVFGIAVFSAYSRVGTLVIFASAIFVVAVGLRYRHLWPRLALIVAIVAGSYGLVHAHASTVEASNAEGYTLNLHKQGWRQRIAMWHAGWRIYLDHPVTGSGLGTYKVQYPKYRTHKDMLNLGNFVHDDYLQFLLEGGPLLLLFLLSFVGLLVKRLVSPGMRLVKGDEGQLEPVLLTVAMGTLLVASLMSFPMYQMQTQMLTGLLFARYIKVSGLMFPARISVSSPRLVKAAVVTGAVIVCAVPVLDAISSQLVLGGGSIPFINRLTDNPRTYVSTMSLLASIRSVNPDNRLEMATIYRSSFDQQKNPKIKRALAIASAMEYQAGLRLNPYHDTARRYFAEFLEENPWLMKQKGIDTTPDKLYQQGIALYPVYIESYMDYAAYLRRQGRAEAAYSLLAHKALPWANLRHGSFFPARLRLFERLLPEARARDDKATLRKMLEAMQSER